MTSTPVQPAESVNGIPVKRSARRSRISIRLHPDGSCELLAPLHVTRPMLETALKQCQSWLERKRKIQTAVPAEYQTHKFEFAPGKTVFYCGKPFVLQLRQTALSRRIIMLDELLITPSAQAGEIQVMLEAFYRRQLRQIVIALLEKYSQCFNITFGKVSINGARGRFGSCNSSGNMNFSWHLAMYPLELIELVVLHELAHRIEMNHSARFYKTLAAFLPDYRQREQLLKLWNRKLADYP